MNWYRIVCEGSAIFVEATDEDSARLYATYFATKAAHLDNEMHVKEWDIEKDMSVAAARKVN